MPTYSSMSKVSDGRPARSACSKHAVPAAPDWRSTCLPLEDRIPPQCTNPPTLLYLPPPLAPAEHHLWGATPFANVVHLSWEAQQAWNASAALMQAAGGDPGAGATSADANTTAAGGVECCLHKSVCAAYYLPDKYQGTPTRNEVRTRCPPVDGCVCISLLPQGGCCFE
jgi:hypothetical protein